MHKYLCVPACVCISPKTASLDNQYRCFVSLSLNGSVNEVDKMSTGLTDYKFQVIKAVPDNKGCTLACPDSN